MTHPVGAVDGAKRAREDAVQECYEAERLYRKARARARYAREREIMAARNLAVAEERYAKAVDTHREVLGLAHVAEALESQT